MENIRPEGYTYKLAIERSKEDCEEKPSYGIKERGIYPFTKTNKEGIINEMLTSLRKFGEKKCTLEGMLVLDKEKIKLKTNLKFQ